MVLAELGGKLRESLRKLHSASGKVDEKQLNTLLSEVSRALIEADVNVKLVMQMRTNVQQKVSTFLEGDKENPNLSKLVQKAVVDEIVALLTPETAPYKLKRSKPNVILFVGLQGAGKTTSIAKFANYYQRRGWKTAMVCADTFRAGAFDQLKQNATKLRIPFYGSYTEADPVLIAEQGVKQFRKDKYEIIIVDTSGRHKQEAALFDEMQEISAAVKPDNTIFVMDATQGQAVYDQAAGFHETVDVGGVIVTKLDGHAKGGGALSAVAATGAPIMFLGSGEHFDDFDPFNAQSFVSKLLGFGDMRGLMEELSSSKKQKELMDSVAKGQFTLRDMYSQMETMTQTGAMQKMMGMIPGVPDYMIPKDGNDENSKRLRTFIHMMDSMNDAELDGKVDLHKYKTDPSMQSRINRIARGSGRHPKEVLMLLQAHKQFQSVVQKMGKSGLVGKQGAEKQKQIAAQMRKNPNAMNQMINQRINQMDPRMLQSMGGADQVRAMMQQQMAAGGPGAGGMPPMGPPGGMPDMSQMAQMMQQMGMSGGGGGFPPGGMPDMNQMAQMMQQMGGGGGGFPPGGMPDMNQMAQMMQQMGMGGGGAPRR